MPFNHATKSKLKKHFSSICSTAYQHSLYSFILKINTFMCCVFSSLEETISYPPLILLKGLEDKKLIKFYLLILITFTSHMESWLFLPHQYSAQPSFHTGQGNILFFYFGTIVPLFPVFVLRKVMSIILRCYKSTSN